MIIVKKNVLSLSIYKMILDLIYLLFIVPNYLYAGFDFDFNLSKFIIANGIFIIMVNSVPNNEKISSCFLHIMLLIQYIPLNSYFYLANESTYWFVLVSLSYFLILFILKIKEWKMVKLKRLRIEDIINILICYSCLFYIMFFLSVGTPKIETLLLKNIYEIRSSLQITRLWGYLIPWQTNSINMILLSFFFVEKKYIKTFIVLIFQILIYMVMPQKTFLFSPFVTIVSILLFKKNKYRESVTKVFFGLIILGYGMYIINSKLITLASLLFRRILFVPALLNYKYFNFVEEFNKLLFYSEGLIGKIFQMKYPFDIKFSNVISEIYFNKPEMASNTGMFADFFVNIGPYGLIIMTIVFGIFLKSLDKLVKQNNEFVFGVFSVSALILTNTSFMTWLITGGGLISILILNFSTSKNLCYTDH